jgi:hypothetical protein
MMEEEILAVYRSGEWNYSDYKTLALAGKEDIKAIRQDIYAEAVTDVDIGLTNSPSNDALWNMWADIFAYIAYVLHGIWTIYEQRLKKAALAAIPHTAYWYSLKAKEFQYGDNLDASQGTVIYPVIDVTKQIVTASAVKEINGSLVLKVAKTGSSGLEPLSAPQLAAFQGYINAVRDAGVSILIVSQNSDLLKAAISIYYNPIIPLATITANVEAAINNYINNLPFDGVFRITKLVDAIQSIEGVVDVKITVCEASTNYTTTPNFVPIDVFYETVAGYMNIDPNFPLSTGLSFIANV